MTKSTNNLKDTKIRILKIMKDGKVHQKDDLVNKIAKQKKMSLHEITVKNKEGRPKWETTVRNSLSELNKAELIVHKKDNNGKRILTYFIIKKSGLETLKLI